MHELATVSVIQDIRPIGGKDRIVLARVENYDSIVQKDGFKVGDKVIYVYYDAVLPVRPELEFLRKRCWSERLQGFRIRPMKMGGHVSEGLVLPITLIEGGGDLPVGTVVTQQLGIRRYEGGQSQKEPSRPLWWMRHPMLRALMKLFGHDGSRPSRGYPEHVPKSDEENIEKCWDSVRMLDDEFIVTEKMEGCAAMYVLDRWGRLHSYSHNREVGASGCWGGIATGCSMRDALRKAGRSLGIRIAVEGEICGPSIQKNIYGFPSYRFFLYGAYDADSGRRLGWCELERVASLTGLDLVPLIGRTKVLGTIDDMLAMCEGESVFSTRERTVPREGLVWRTEDGGVHFKCKSRPYKVWFEK